MPLYAANVMDVAQPIEKKGKKVKKEEVLPVAEEVPVVKKEKKEPTEKQLAALAKAQETRKRKREEAEAVKKAEEEAIKAKEDEIRAKEEEIERKKEAMKEKRRLARLAKKQEVSPPPTTASSETVEEPEEEVKKVAKPKQQQRDELEPPAWFQKYIAGVKQEEAKQSQGKIPKKQIAEEARTVAHEQWQDGLTRDRVQNEVDSHMNRMYGMIFNNRRFK